MKTLNCLVLVLMFLSCTKNPDFALSGKLSNTAVFLKAQSTGSVTKNITHIMAISPESADPERYVGTVDKSGSFKLDIASGKPYVLVFVASEQGFKGPDMIVGIFKISAIDLDILAPVKAGKADLGDVKIDKDKKQAEMSTTVDALLTSLGLTAKEAAYLGKIDGLSLRSANPDIDGNGVIDALENKNFHMDWHIRADMFIGDQRAKLSDAANAFLSNPTLTYSLNSGYAVYPGSYYGSICPLNTGVATDLAAGCGFDILSLDGVSVLGSWPYTSMSGGAYGDMKQWGPDFRPMATPGEEMPGSLGVGVQMVYTMPGDKKLTFWNVITRTYASLTADGLILPFLKFNLSDSGSITSLGYEWRKLESSAWVLASAAEVSLMVNENGGYAMFYTSRAPGSEAGVSVTIPRNTPSGTIPWDSKAPSKLDSFCNSAVSYDDKLGLRIFAGGFAPNDGVTLCP